jgi:NAD(P)-dependent dehydrogenase (short-subunit alcohol dehydrogenase family)
MATWIDVFKVNSIAPILISRVLKENLCLSKNPRALTISSQMGALSGQSEGMFIYRSSKAAVNKSVQLLAREFAASNITVCSLHPGWVRTDMGGESADIGVEESAEGILKLARRLSMSETGRFFNWQGVELAW